MSTISIITHPENDSQAEAIKAFLKALKIKFEVSNDQPYNPEFVAKIKNSEQEFKDGKFTRVKKEDLHNFLGL